MIDSIEKKIALSDYPDRAFMALCRKWFDLAVMELVTENQCEIWEAETSLDAFLLDRAAKLELHSENPIDGKENRATASNWQQYKLRIDELTDFIMELDNWRELAILIYLKNEV